MTSAPADAPVALLNEARGHWKGGGPLRAGEIVWAQLGADQRPRWAAAILGACLEAVDQVPVQLAAVLDVAGDPPRWREAHRVFDAIRDLVLRVERGELRPTPPATAALFVGENAARVLYNANSTPDPFDEDSGAWLVASARTFVERVRDAAAEERVWKAIATLGTSDDEALAGRA